MYGVGRKCGGEGTIDAAMLRGAGIVNFVHRIQMAIVGADWLDYYYYYYSQKKAVMILFKKRDVYFGLRQL